MPKLFGPQLPELDFKITLKILSFFDNKTLSAMNILNKQWHPWIESYQVRLKIFHTVLKQCDFFTHVTLDSFNVSRMSGGMTNSTFKLHIDGNPYVVRLPGKNTNLYINRGEEYTNASLASTLGINAPILYYDKDNGCQLTTFLKDPLPMTAETLQNPFYLKKAILALKSIHTSASRFANDIDVFIRNQKMLDLVKHKQAHLITKYLPLIKDMEKIRWLVATLNVPLTACHNDVTPTNLVFSLGKMHIIDWEYSGNNYALWDLVCLAREAEFSNVQIELMLKIYYKNIEPHTRHIFNLLMPVYDYWVCLWSCAQIANNNCADTTVITQLEAMRFRGCCDLLRSDLFREAFKTLSKTIDPGKESILLNKNRFFQSHSEATKQTTQCIIQSPKVIV